ncbi:hypothetical protein [Pseudoduganella lurida]|uniref:hypothetical protein n=1 Tax=Pseudoduganella lurida TaxID=1036180 RepID=UPI001E2EFE94|nr:hypothetical protein [Pseudoduganella lurida]
MAPESRPARFAAPDGGQQEPEAAQANAGAGDQGQERQEENQAGDGYKFYVGILG